MLRLMFIVGDSMKFKKQDEYIHVDGGTGVDNWFIAHVNIIKKRVKDFSICKCKGKYWMIFVYRENYYSPIKIDYRIMDSKLGIPRYVTTISIESNTRPKENMLTQFELDHMTEINKFLEYEPNRGDTLRFFISLVEYINNFTGGVFSNLLTPLKDIINGEYERYKAGLPRQIPYDLTYT